MKILSLLVMSVLLASIASAEAGFVTAPVPETGTTLGLFAIGFVAVAALRRKLGK
ncbi:MAG TPA: VPDSG-CTERM sorting domain-containing protein [Chthoniobacterales bacterium]|jgi:hypothetical protein